MRCGPLVTRRMGLVSDRAFERFIKGDLMADAVVTDVIGRQRDNGRVHTERSRGIADVPDVSADRFAGKAWVIGDVDTQSFMDAVLAIERLCDVRFATSQDVEPTCVADRTNAPATAAFRAGRLSGSSHLIDPAAFDW